MASCTTHNTIFCVALPCGHVCYILNTSLLLSPYPDQPSVIAPYTRPHTSGFCIQGKRALLQNQTGLHIMTVAHSLHIVTAWNAHPAHTAAHAHQPKPSLSYDTYGASCLPPVVCAAARVLPLLAHPLKPLGVCLPSVVNEFRAQLGLHGLLVGLTPEMLSPLVGGWS